MRNPKVFAKIDKQVNEEQKYQVTCKCGTKTVMVKADKTICRGCHHWIYRTPQIEFREKVKERLKKMNNDLLAEKYHNELEQKYFYELEKIDREKYNKLLDEYEKLRYEYEDLKAGHECFIEKIKEYVRQDKASDLAEFLVSEGIKL